MKNYFSKKITDFSKILKNKNLFFFLIGCSSLFFSCQLIKTSPILIKNSDNYNNCYEILKTRLNLHNTGNGAKFTKGRKWKLVYYEKYVNKSLAMKNEFILKKNYKLRKKIILK